MLYVPERLSLRKSRRKTRRRGVTMRIAIVSDIHGNVAALEAVIEDLQRTSPDLIVHGGDLAHGGSSPCEVVDRVRELGWPGVMGNTDEMLYAPEAFAAIGASASVEFQRLFAVIGEMAAHTRAELGEERLAWLQTLPRMLANEPFALVHARPESLWRSPGPEASDEELAAVYGTLGKPIAVFAHIHRPFVRQMQGLGVINTGSVSLSQDGDPRASYLLLDDGEPTIRRVEYEIQREVAALRASGLPHAEWAAKSLVSAKFEMP